MGSTQAPLQEIFGLAHTRVWQWLATHDAPVGQTRPQAPQLFGSSAVLVQVQVVAPQQAESGEAQPHWPPTQVRPMEVQSLPQPPQVWGSVLGLMQAPLPQRRSGGRQLPLEHWLLEQV